MQQLDDPKKTHYPTQDTKIQQQNQYMSLLCRNGPMPDRYLHFTNIGCLVSFLVLLILSIIILCINSKNAASINEDIFHSNITLGPIFYMIPEIVSIVCMMVFGWILALLTMLIPSIMAIFNIILLLLGLLFFSFYFIYYRFLQNIHQATSLFFSICSLLAFFITCIIICKRSSKIIHLGSFLRISSIVLKDNLILLSFTMLLLSMVQILSFWLLVHYYYQINSSQNQSNQTILYIFVFIIFYLCLHGVFIALSDYITISYTVHWYFSYKHHASKGDQNQTQPPQIQQNYPSHHNCWQTYSALKYHFGTIIFGSILSYIPQYLLTMLHRRQLHNPSSSLPWLLTYSKYCYLQTIMEYVGFHTANKRIYELRKRIKSNVPELYMLGHLYGDIMKLFLCLFTMGLFLLLRHLATSQSNPGGTILTTIIFGGGLGLQIATNFTNMVGMLGDVVFMVYNIDIQIERVHYNNSQPYSTPSPIIAIIRKLTVNRSWTGQIQSDKIDPMPI